MEGMVATVAGVGFVLGLRHALDPDHVVAVTTLASQRIGLRRTSLVGAFWGLGHALTLGVVGGAILMLRLTVPPAVSAFLESLVAVMLVVLGALAPAQGPALACPRPSPSARRDDARPLPRPRARRRRSRPPASASLAGRPAPVPGGHGARPGRQRRPRAARPRAPPPRWRRGSSTWPSSRVGSVAGMLLLSAVMSVPLAYVESRYGRLHRVVQVAAGAVSVAFGLYLLWHYAAGPGAAAGLS